MLVLILTQGFKVFAQNVSKPPLNAGTFNNWAGVGGGLICPNGDYVCYDIYGQPSGSRKLVIASTINNWKEEFTNASSSSFTKNSKLLIFKSGKDSLCLFNLVTKSIICIPSVGNFSLTEENQAEWLVYRSSNPDKELVVYNLQNSHERHFSSVMTYKVSPKGKGLLLEIAKDDQHIKLQYADLSGNNVTTIWPGVGQEAKPGNYVFDKEGNQLVFSLENKKDDQSIYQLWYYKIGMDTAVMLANNQTPGLENGFDIADGVPTFSDDSKRIFFSIHQIAQQKPKNDTVNMDVWSYTDTMLQPLQLAQRNYSPGFTVLLNLGENRMTRIEQRNESIFASSNDYLLIRRELSNNSSEVESTWNRAAQFSFYLVATKDGSRKLLKDHIDNPNGGLGLSPDGKWIIYYDFKQKTFFSYETSTGVIRNITRGCPTIWTSEENNYPQPSLTWVPWINTWLAEDKAVLIYDNYDIWEVDPSCKIPPINLTNGYGRIHNIKFQLVDKGEKLENLSQEKTADLLLFAFNKSNKNSGYYIAKLHISKNPTLCGMGAYVYGFWDGGNPLDPTPLKAKNSSLYLIVRMSAVDAPNYFVTNDFKKYTVLSSVQPQKPYNWLTATLVHWKTFDGSTAAGILYKPENFNPNNKYPLIFDYYERRSDELNLFITPRAPIARINIPWFVSHGYLVFVPDIRHDKISEPGPAAYDAVVSAAKYLSKFSWVDAKRMGIQGHSFGGYETNYLVTHTNIFAAACSASSFCDLISWYGSAARAYPMYWAESQQGRIGATLWQRPDLYIKNSPIFKVNQVTTPLLMMNNQDDNVVPFSQGVEFFSALRRLGKKVWMLQYDGSRHSVLSDIQADDYNIRMTQFFDYYLKGAPAPKWMIKGVPADRKGIDNGLALEPKGIRPGPGLTGN